MSQGNNPYAQAAGTYDTHAKDHTPDQRELEARILLKSNRMLRDLLDGWDERTTESMEKALTYNRQIWLLFYDTALENKDGERPDDLRSNIVNLANFIFKRETEILSDPQPHKFDILISINREISAGLMSNAQKASRENKASTPNTPPPPEPGTRTDISG